MNLNLIERRAFLLNAGFTENSKGELVKRVNETRTHACLYPFKAYVERDRTGKVLGMPRTLRFEPPRVPAGWDRIEA